MGSGLGKKYKKGYWEEVKKHLVVSHGMDEKDAEERAQKYWEEWDNKGKKTRPGSDIIYHEEPKMIAMSIARDKEAKEVQTQFPALNFEIKECATLGTLFADVYLNGKLFARELSREIAETFIKYPLLYPNALADETKLRTWMIENWDEEVCTDILPSMGINPVRNTNQENHP